MIFIPSFYNKPFKLDMNENSFLINDVEIITKPINQVFDIHNRKSIDIEYSETLISDETIELLIDLNFKKIHDTSNYISSNLQLINKIIKDMKDIKKHPYDNFYTGSKNDYHDSDIFTHESGMFLSLMYENKISDTLHTAYQFAGKSTRSTEIDLLLHDMETNGTFEDDLLYYFVLSFIDKVVTNTQQKNLLALFVLHNEDADIMDDYPSIDRMKQLFNSTNYYGMPTVTNGTMTNLFNDLSKSEVLMDNLLTELINRLKRKTIHSYNYYTTGMLNINTTQYSYETADKVTAADVLSYNYLLPSVYQEDLTEDDSFHETTNRNNTYRLKTKYNQISEDQYKSLFRINKNGISRHSDIKFEDYLISDCGMKHYLSQENKNNNKLYAYNNKKVESMRSIINKFFTFKNMNKTIHFSMTSNNKYLIVQGGDISILYPHIDFIDNNDSTKKFDILIDKVGELSESISNSIYDKKLKNFNHKINTINVNLNENWNDNPNFKHNTIYQKRYITMDYFFTQLIRLKITNVMDYFKLINYSINPGYENSKGKNFNIYLNSNKDWMNNNSELITKLNKIYQQYLVHLTKRTKINTKQHTYKSMVKTIQAAVTNEKGISFEYIKVHNLLDDVNIYPDTFHKYKLIGNDINELNSLNDKESNYIELAKYINDKKNIKLSNDFISFMELYDEQLLILKTDTNQSVTAQLLLPLFVTNSLSHYCKFRRQEEYYVTDIKIDGISMFDLEWKQNSTNTIKYKYPDTFNKFRKQLEPYKLWSYQKDDICENVIKKKGILGSDMGVGKTIQQIMIGKLSDTNKRLFITKKAYSPQFISEFTKWGETAIHLNSVESLSMINDSDVNNYVIDYELLNTSLYNIKKQLKEYAQRLNVIPILEYYYLMKKITSMNMSQQNKNQTKLFESLKQLKTEFNAGLIKNILQIFNGIDMNLNKKTVGHKIRKMFNFISVDECHGYISESATNRLIENMKAEYFIFASGTPIINGMPDFLKYYNKTKHSSVSSVVKFYHPDSKSAININRFIESPVYKEDKANNHNIMLDIKEKYSIDGSNDFHILISDIVDDLLDAHMTRRLSKEPALDNKVPSKYRYIKQPVKADDKLINTYIRLFKEHELSKIAKETDNEANKQVKTILPHLIKSINDPINGNAKLNQVMLDISKMPKDDKIIIFCEYNDTTKNIENLCNHYKHTCINLNKYSNIKRGYMVQKFKEDDNIKILIMTTKAGAHAYDLPEANWVLNVEFPWKYYWKYQAIRRTMRPGQKKDVTVVDYYHPNLIDEAMNQHLENNKVTSMNLMDKKSEAIVKTNAYMEIARAVSQKYTNIENSIEPKYGTEELDIDFDY